MEPNDEKSLEHQITMLRKEVRVVKVLLVILVGWFVALPLLHALYKLGEGFGVPGLPIWLGIFIGAPCLLLLTKKSRKPSTAPDSDF